MDVALDTNVFFADRNLESTPFRVLLNYLRQTHSRLILLQPVRAELEAKVRAEIFDATSGIEKAIRNAERKGLTDLPAFDARSVANESFDEWYQRWTIALEAYKVDVPCTIESYREAFRRATVRDAPSEDGAMRDSVVWLSLVHFLRDERASGPVAFITRDSDFTSKEQLEEESSNQLHWLLKVDAAQAGCPVHHFDSLHAFNVLHADPLKGYTAEWVHDRVNEELIDELVSNELHSRTNEFIIANSDYREFFEPVVYHDIYSLAWSFEDQDVYAWMGDDGVVALELMVQCEAAREADCDLMRRPYYNIQEFLDEDGDLKRSATLECVLEGQVLISAVALNDKVDLLNARSWRSVLDEVLRKRDGK